MTEVATQLSPAHRLREWKWAPRLAYLQRRHPAATRRLMHAVAVGAVAPVVVVGASGQSQCPMMGHRVTEVPVVVASASDQCRMMPLHCWAVRNVHKASRVAADVVRQ